MQTKGIKTIGVLTSGGDAPGMNAAIRAVTRTAIYNGIRVLGIKKGYNGLITGAVEELEIRSVSNIIHRGGTILYTARSKEFESEHGKLAATKTCEEYGIDALVVIGGDGSFKGAHDFSAYGIPCICIPGTIDNDLACSEYTIGYDTAMNTAMELVDKLRDTAQSHRRCSVVEVMGRHAGYIALNTGIATGAVVVLVPEMPFDFEKDIVQRMNNTRLTGKEHFIVIVAEGAGSAIEIAKQIEEKTGIEARSTILGHVQRGGTPTLRDRVVASEMGYHAVSILAQGFKNRAVAMYQNNIVDFDLGQALLMKKELDKNAIETAQTISI